MESIIKQLTTDNINALVLISDRCFGSGFMTSEFFIKRIKSNKNDVVILINNTLAGFCLSSTIDNEDQKTYPFPSSIENNKSAIIKTIAISPELQNQGLGSKLIDHLLEFYSHKKFKEIYYPAWLENDKLFFFDKIKSKGFTSIGTYHKYWKKASLKENFICKKCGPPPCKCTMQFLKLEL